MKQMKDYKNKLIVDLKNRNILEKNGFRPIDYFDHLKFGRMYVFNISPKAIEVLNKYNECCVITKEL